MPTIRVYATDSFAATGKSVISGGSWGCSFDNDGERAPTVAMNSQYNFRATPSPLADVESVTALACRFDLNSIPALRGKLVLSINGPFAFVRESSTYLSCSNGALPSVYSHPDGLPFAEFLLSFPADPARENRLGSTSMQYLNIGSLDNSPHLNGGLYQIARCAALSIYPHDNGKYYAGWATGYMDTHLGVNPPYIEVTYQDAYIEVVNCAPLSGFLNEKQVNRLSWSLAMASPEAIGGVIQSSAKIQWQHIGDTTVNTIHVNGATNYYDVPANTFPNGDFCWQVMVVGDEGQQSPYSDWYTITTRDTQTLPPTHLVPNGAFLDAAKPISLSWRHNSPLSTPPSAFEVESENQSGAWVPLSGKVAGSNSAYTVPANRFTGGVVRWRVRDYNSDGIASAFSAPASFTARGGPPLPEFRSIESSSNRPLVSWLSPTQVAFQLKVLQNGKERFDSQVVFGSDPSYRMPVFLENGRYTFSLRVQNAYGLWSSYVNRDSVILAKAGLAIQLIGTPVDNGAQLDFSVEVV